MLEEESWINLSIGYSVLLGYSNGASTTGTSSGGKSLRKFFRNTSLVSGVTPIQNYMSNTLNSFRLNPHSFNISLSDNQLCCSVLDSPVLPNISCLLLSDVSVKEIIIPIKKLKSRGLLVQMRFLPIYLRVALIYWLFHYLLFNLSIQSYCFSISNCWKLT